MHSAFSCAWLNQAKRLKAGGPSKLSLISPRPPPRLAVSELGPAQKHATEIEMPFPKGFQTGGQQPTPHTARRGCFAGGARAPTGKGLRAEGQARRAHARPRRAQRERARCCVGHRTAPGEPHTRRGAGRAAVCVGKQRTHPAAPPGWAVPPSGTTFVGDRRRQFLLLARRSGARLERDGAASLVKRPRRSAGCSGGCARWDSAPAPHRGWVPSSLARDGSLAPREKCLAPTLSCKVTLLASLPVALFIN